MFLHSPFLAFGGSPVPDAEVLLQLLIQFGYAALFILTFLKGFTIVLIAGALAHQGFLALPLVMLCSFAGSLAGDEVEYYIGRRYGPVFLARRPRLTQAARRIHGLISRYDLYFMLGFRFIYGARIVTPLLLGLEKVPPGRFFCVNAIGALIWAVITSLAGYGISDLLVRLVDGMDSELRAALLIIFLVALSYISRLLYLRRKRKNLSILPQTAESKAE